MPHDSKVQLCVQDSEEERSSCKRRAADERQSATSMRASDAGATQDLGEDARVGLLGLGDLDYPITKRLFNEIAEQPAFMDDNAKQWSAAHGEVISKGAFDPSTRPRRQCASFCVQTFSDTHGLPVELIRKSMALLQLVNRALKDLYKRVQRRISATERHPLLFVRMVGDPVDVGGTLTKAWLLTRATFRPRSVDGIVVRLPGADQMAQPEFSVTLGIEQVQHSDLRFPKFVCMDELACQIALLQKMHPEHNLQYCYNPAYYLKVSDGLTVLYLAEGLRWVQPGELQVEESVDENPVDEDDELDEISEMVASMPGLGQTGRPRPRAKARQRQQRRGNREREGQPAMKSDGP